MYNGNSLNLDRFFDKLDNWVMTVTEDIVPAEAKKYVFKQFHWHLPEVLQELYLVAAKGGKMTTLKEADKWLNVSGAGGPPPCCRQEVESHQAAA